MIYNEAYWKDVERVIPHVKDIKKLYGKTILITGGAGLICSCVVDIIYYLNTHDNANIRIIHAARTHEEPADRFPHMKERITSSTPRPTPTPPHMSRSLSRPWRQTLSV